ncbi:MAG: restriction endonuclease subunit S [Comamonadaceae bacterium]|nr:MAG: restriction endonuclease subunit S [Comamonadaceae bacterium]
MSTSLQWPTKRIRFVTKRNRSPEQLRRLSEASEATFLAMEAIGEQGEVDLSLARSVAEVSSGYTQFFDGDVVVAKITPCFENGKGALITGLLGGIGFGTTELHVLTPTSELDGRFLYYITASRSFRRLGEGSMIGAAGQKRVPEDFVRDFRISLPPVFHQRAIAKYLDRETGRLDALVTAKERVLRLLAEKRQGLITHAVTRGLDPRAPVRDSGIPWLGEIPAHWEVKRLKYLFGLVADPAPPDNDFELLSLYTDIGVRPRKELEARGNKSTTTDSYWMVQPGDLIVNKLLAWMGAFGVSEYVGVTSPAYDILRPAADVDPYYYHHLFRCGICQPEIRRRSYGIMDMRLRLYFDRFGDMPVPVPPRTEQEKILERVTDGATQVDRVVQATKRTIALLKERRAALIAAAVTGQIEVY